MRSFETLGLAGLLLGAVGCASAAPAIHEAKPSADGTACLALADKLWDRDTMESLRALRRGAELRDGECCRRYLARAESASVNLSQRLYARLFVERILRKGRVTTASGEDATSELYTQLCWAWRYTEPRCPSKAKQVLEAMVESGLPRGDRSAFVAEMLRETGVRPAGVRSQEISLYAAESADEARSWLQVPLGDRRETGDWTQADVSVWGGGSDRLVLGTNVLAFLCNAQGEPTFHGRYLWICNLGASPVYFSSIATGHAHRELLPGHEEFHPVDSFGLAKGETTTGIPLSVRYRRPIR